MLPVSAIFEIGLYFSRVKALNCFWYKSKSCFKGIARKKKLTSLQNLKPAVKREVAKATKNEKDASSSEDEDSNEENSKEEESGKGENAGDRSSSDH